MTDNSSPLPQAQDLAAEFAALLFVRLGNADFDSMIQANEREHAGTSTCASHDFCDSNMVMFDAIKSLRPGTTPGELLHSQAWTNLWNEAWSLAKEQEFKALAQIGRDRQQG